MNMERIKNPVLNSHRVMGSAVALGMTLFSLRRMTTVSLVMKQAQVDTGVVCLMGGWVILLQSTVEGGFWRTRKPMSRKKMWAGFVSLNCACFPQVLFPWILRGLSELGAWRQLQSHFYWPHSALWWLGACASAPGFLFLRWVGMQLSTAFWAICGPGELGEKSRGT